MIEEEEPTCIRLWDQEQDNALLCSQLSNMHVLSLLILQGDMGKVSSDLNHVERCIRNRRGCLCLCNRYILSWRI